MTSFERIHPTRATNRESQEQARLGTVNRGSFTGQLTFTEDPSTPIQEVIVKWWTSDLFWWQPYTRTPGWSKTLPMPFPGSLLLLRNQFSSGIGTSLSFGNELWCIAVRPASVTGISVSYERNLHPIIPAAGTNVIRNILALPESSSAFESRLLYSGGWWNSDDYSRNYFRRSRSNINQLFIDMESIISRPNLNCCVGQW